MAGGPTSGKRQPASAILAPTTTLASGKRMNLSSVRRGDVAAIIVGLGFGPLAEAEPRRAEELEQLRINTGYIIEAGELEIDIIPSYFDYDGASERNIEAELEFAVSERLMFEVEVPYRWVDVDGGGEDLSGVGNIEVGAKWLVAERGAWATAFNVDVELPGSDDDGIADDLWGVELALPMSFYFADSHTRLHVEPGVEWKEHEGFEEQLLNIALEHRPNGSSNFALQLGSNVVREEGDVEAYLIPAFEVAATTVPFQFGMGIAAGLTSESANWGVLLDFEVEF